jgi:hypothetical protein
MKKYLFTIFAVLFLTSVTLYSQEPEEEIIPEETPDTTETDDTWDNFIFEEEDDDDGEDEEFDFDFFEFGSDSWSSRSYNLKKSPTISLFYGMNNPSVNSDHIGLELNPINSVYLSLGYTDIYNRDMSSSLLNVKRKELFLHTANTSIGETIEEGSATMNSWQFGFNNLSGYGWRIAQNQSVSLFHSSGINWTKTEFTGDAINQLDSLSQYRIDRYGDSFRFGDMFDVGINIRVLEFASIEASYGKSLVFERHLFWYWTLSEVIEASGHGMLDYFIKKVANSTPWAAPVVNVALKGALSYGLYELRKSDMYWPLKSAPPIVNEHFKVGVSFTF